MYYYPAVSLIELKVTSEKDETDNSGDGLVMAKTGAVLIPKNEDDKNNTGDTDTSLPHKEEGEEEKEEEKVKDSSAVARDNSVPSSLDEDWVNLSVSPNHPLHQQGSAGHPLEDSGGN